MFIPEAALEELSNAEAAIMSFMGTLVTGEVILDPDVMPMLLAVLRSVATSRGMLQAQKMVEEMTQPFAAHPGYCQRCGHEVGS